MRIKHSFLALFLVIGLAVPATAEVKGVYGGLKFIDSIQSTDATGDRYTQNTIGGGIFVGYDFFPQNEVPVRAEIEYAIRTNYNQSMDKTWNTGGFRQRAEAKGQWNLQTLFLNAYWDLHNNTAFTPYIGAGLGMGFIQNKYSWKGSGLIDFDESTLDNQTVFAWNAGVGCSYAFTENFSADLAYRFVKLAYHETTITVLGEKTKFGASPYANEFSLGLRFTF